MSSHLRRLVLVSWPILRLPKHPFPHHESTQVSPSTPQPIFLCSSTLAHSIFSSSTQFYFLTLVSFHPKATVTPCASPSHACCSPFVTSSDHEEATTIPFLLFIFDSAGTFRLVHGSQADQPPTDYSKFPSIPPNCLPQSSSPEPSLTTALPTNPVAAAPRTNPWRTGQAGGGDLAASSKSITNRPRPSSK